MMTMMMMVVVEVRYAHHTYLAVDVITSPTTGPVRKKGTFTTGDEEGGS